MKLVYFICFLLCQNAAFSQNDGLFSNILLRGTHKTIPKRNIKVVPGDPTIIEKRDIEDKMDSTETSFGSLPLDSIYITSNFGLRIHPIKGTKKIHSGVDLRAVDKPIYAIQKGIISEVGYSGSLGSYVKLLCGDFEFVYGHLGHVYVTQGKVVEMGSTIGLTGGTGDVTGKHLHFAIKFNGKFIKPENCLRFLGV